MIVAFNKVLHIWRYEKSDHILRDSVDEAYNNCNSWHSSGPKAQGIDQFTASAFGGPYSFSALSSHYYNTPTKEVHGVTKDLLMDQLQEIELKQSTTRIKDMDGFKFKSSLGSNGIRKYEFIEDSFKQRKTGGAISSQHSDTRADSGMVPFGGDHWEQYYELENSSHFLGDPSAYLLQDDTLRMLSIDGRKMNQQQRN